MSSNSVDLSAFPVIRLDQVSILDDTTLINALEEVAAMMGESDFPQQKMSKYLRKQYDSMVAEHNRRQAAARVEQLLSGAIDALNQTYSPRFEPSQGTSKQLESSKANDNVSNNKAQDGFMATKKLVLTDTPLSSSSSKSISTTLKANAVADIAASRTSQSAPTTAATPTKPLTDDSNNTSSGATTSTTSALHQTISKPYTADAAIKSLPLESTSATNIDRNIHDATTDTPRSTVSGSGKTPRMRKNDSSPASASNNPEDNIPSKKSLEIVYRNFGNEFIVAATERKRRFVPKKEPVESVEDRKDRERLERRKIAMERLVKRREEEEAHKMKLREQRRQEKLKRLRKEREENSHNNNDDNSSGSESVSGGDDDKNITVDESLLPAVQAALIDNGPRTFVVKLAPGQRYFSNNNNNSKGSKTTKTTTKDDKNTSSAEPRVRPPLPAVPRRASVPSKSSSTSNNKSSKKEVAKNSNYDSAISVASDVETETEDNRDQHTDNDNEEDEKVLPEATADSDANNGVDGDKNNSSSDIDDDNGDNNSDHNVDESTQFTGISSSSSMFNDSLSTKNLSALATIRKLKEAKLGKSIIKVESHDEETNDVHESDDGNNHGVDDDNNHATEEVIEQRYSANGLSNIDDIVQRAMQAVSRATTPHSNMMNPANTKNRPVSGTSRSSSHNSNNNSNYDANNGNSDETMVSARSARQWSFDDLLPILLAALHVQRVVHTAEVDLLQVMGDTVMFNFGPDDLPGLRALQLVQHRHRSHHTSNSSSDNNTNSHAREFRVSLEEYHNRIYSEENAEIFDYRSMKRREISLGLVLLAITCHRILFGKVHIVTVSDFQHAWLAAIQSFDNQASRAARDAQETAYFALVPVCGNGYAICKKLEILLESYFTPLIMTRTTMTTNNLSESIAADVKDDTENAEKVKRVGVKGDDTVRRELMSRCLSARQRNTNTYDEIATNHDGSRDDHFSNSNNDNEYAQKRLRSRCDSQDSLLDFLQLPVITANTLQLHNSSSNNRKVSSSNNPQQNDPVTDTLQIKTSRRSHSNSNNDNNKKTKDDEGSDDDTDDDDDEAPPPSSAAVSVLSHNTPHTIHHARDNVSSLSRPTSSASSSAYHQGPNSRPLPTVYTSAAAPAAAAAPHYSDTNTSASAQEYAKDAQQLSYGNNNNNHNNRPLSGRRSAAAAQFRTQYLGTSGPNIDNNNPTQQQDTNNSMNAKYRAEEERHRTQRQRLAQYAQTLQAGDVLTAAAEEEEDTAYFAASNNNTRVHNSNNNTHNNDTNKALISFSQLEEELAAADAALAYVLQGEKPLHATHHHNNGNTHHGNQQKLKPSQCKPAATTNNADENSSKKSGNANINDKKNRAAAQTSSSDKIRSNANTSTHNSNKDKEKTTKRRASSTTENVFPSDDITNSTNTAGNGNGNSEGKSALIDYYPQFAMIFPMAYSQSQAVRDDMGYARGILESMQVQAKVYEEWVEVMRDYSTVFCHPPEHNNNKDKDKDHKSSHHHGHGHAAHSEDSDHQNNDDDNRHHRPAVDKKSKRPRRKRPSDSDRDDTNNNSDNDNDNDDDDHANANAKNEEEEAAAENLRRSAAVYKGGNRTLHYRVKSSRSEVFNIVCDVFRSSLPQWENLPAGLGLGLSWNLLWTWSKPRINHAHLLVWQKVNHFEESRQLTRKDFLKKNMQRYTDMPHSVAKEFEIMPLTFLLPHEYNAFVSAFTQLESQKINNNSSANTNNNNNNHNSTAAANAASAVNLNYWILKPVGLSRGRGISLIRDLGDLTYASASVIQKYVENPLCLQHYKFDLRIYVVVTSFKPLEAFIYREGFARVSLEAYSTQPQDMDNLFIHLTNSSIQKKHVSGPSKDNPVQTGQDSGQEAEVGGSKISLLGNQGLWKRLELYSNNTIRSDEIWQSICTLIVKSLVAVDDKIPHQPNCFELFGYDVLIDSNLRPWLIEVNASPSLARENALDHRVKNMVIRDIIELLDVAPYDRAALARVMRKRLTNIAKQRHVHGRNDAELEQDLQDILGDYRPRKIGEMPAKLGLFERLAPDTPYFQQVMKLKKKLFKDA